MNINSSLITKLKMNFILIYHCINAHSRPGTSLQYLDSPPGSTNFGKHCCKEYNMTGCPIKKKK